MSEIAIRCEGVSKQYRIGQRESYRALRDVIANAAKAPYHRLRSAFRSNGPSSGNGNGSHIDGKVISALHEVSFEVNRGEVVGIVGRNGAGKSTLLKVLSRITRPTHGHIEIRGRVGSLLEVGTGFHPELTGRENIYLNGAILGMRKVEIDRKFDEIVAFAEVDKFIDTPVKRFSSGMYVRLAFAVAAHMETDVLMVDEVLAVGDREFQKKCLGKLDDVSKQGRTVVLVSHQMNQIRQLCNSAIWLNNGEIRMIGRAGQTVAAYEEATTSIQRETNTQSSFLRWTIEGSANVLLDGLKPVQLTIDVWLKEDLINGHLGVHILGEDNVNLASWGFDGIDITQGEVQFRLELPCLPLSAGIYTISCSLFNFGNNLTGGNLIDKWSGTPVLVVEAGAFSHPQDLWSGVLNLPGNLTAVQRRDQTK